MNNDNIKVELTWIRHGISCSNLLAYTQKMYKSGKLTKNMSNEVNFEPENISYKDPHLSNFGISHLYNVYNSDFYREEYKPDLIACSQLIRTMETAYILFYNNLLNSNNSLLSKLYVCPYISEFESNNLFHLKDEVDPFPPNENKERFNEFKQYLTSNLQEIFPVDKNIKLVYLSKNPESNRNVNNINESNWTSNYFEPPQMNSYDNFIEKILPKLINIVLKKNPEKKYIKIAIACHGNYIRKHIINTYKFEIKKNGSGQNVLDNHGKQIIVSEDQDVPENVNILYSPPKNADAYREIYNINKNGILLGKDPQVTQVFPEKKEHSFMTANNKIERNKNERFNNLDKFKFLFINFTNETNKDPKYDIKDKYVVSTLIKDKKKYSNENKFNAEVLNNDNFWRNVLGLCYSPYTKKMYLAHYNKVKNNLEGGKKRKTTKKRKITKK